MSAVPASAAELRVLRGAREIAARGKAIGLPMIATCADISSARPVTVRDGTPVAALFEFASDAREYWLQGDLALQNAIVTVTRWTAEPFYYDHGVISGWQQMRIAPELLQQTTGTNLSICASIVAFKLEVETPRLKSAWAFLPPNMPLEAARNHPVATSSDISN